MKKEIIKTKNSINSRGNPTYMPSSGLYIQFSYWGFEKLLDVTIFSLTSYFYPERQLSVWLAGQVFLLRYMALSLVQDHVVSYA